MFALQRGLRVALSAARSADGCICCHWSGPTKSYNRRMITRTAHDAFWSSVYTRIDTHARELWCVHTDVSGLQLAYANPLSSLDINRNSVWRGSQVNLHCAQCGNACIHALFCACRCDCHLPALLHVCWQPTTSPADVTVTYQPCCMLTTCAHASLQCWPTASEHSVYRSHAWWFRLRTEMSVPVITNSMISQCILALLQSPPPPPPTSNCQFESETQYMIL